MERYLIDTNVVADYLCCNLPLNGMMTMDAIINDVPNLSVITQIELLCWRTETSIEQLVNNFIDDIRMYDIGSGVIKHCVFVRKGKKIKTPDAIIAATALAQDLTLVTDNERDFKQIPGLRLLNPHSPHNVYL